MLRINLRHHSTVKFCFRIWFHCLISFASATNCCATVCLLCSRGRQHPELKDTNIINIWPLSLKKYIVLTDLWRYNWTLFFFLRERESQPTSGGERGEEERVSSRLVQGVELYMGLDFTTMRSWFGGLTNWGTQARYPMEV